MAGCTAMAIAPCRWLRNTSGNGPPGDLRRHRSLGSCPVPRQLGHEDAHFGRAAGQLDRGAEDGDVPNRRFPEPASGVARAGRREKERLGAAKLKISALQHQVSYLVSGAHPMHMYAVGAVPAPPSPPHRHGRHSRRSRRNSSDSTRSAPHRRRRSPSRSRGRLTSTSPADRSGQPPDHQAQGGAAVQELPQPALCCATAPEKPQSAGAGGGLQSGPGQQGGSLLQSPRPPQRRGPAASLAGSRDRLEAKHDRAELHRHGRVPGLAVFGEEV